MTVEAIIDLGIVQTSTLIGDEILRGKNTTYQITLSTEVPSILTNEITEIRETLQRSTSEWDINEDQFRSANFEPLIKEGYVPVYPVVQERQDLTPEMTRALKLQSEFIEVVYLWKKNQAVTGDELAELDTCKVSNVSEEKKQLSSIFPVLLCYIGRDENEISDSPKRILDGSWKQTWKGDLTQTLESFIIRDLKPSGSRGEVCIPSAGKVIDMAVRDFKHRVMAQNYLILITDMKENDTFPKEWDYKQRLANWEKTMVQSSKSKDINCKYKKTKEASTLTKNLSFSSLADDCLRSQAISMAARLGYTMDKIPKGLVDIYVQLRNRTFPTQTQSAEAPQSNTFKRPIRKPKHIEVQKSEPTTRVPVASDQEIFARALGKCGMPNRKKEFMLLYPEIFNNTD
jgi:hypothetical protein